MSFLNEAKNVMEADSPFFKAEVLREYKFLLVSTRVLTDQDKLYDEKAPKWEFTMQDLETGKQKIWTTGGQVVRDMIALEIDEGDSFSIVKTGDIGKGKRYWKINKLVNPPKAAVSPAPALKDDAPMPTDDEIPIEF